LEKVEPKILHHFSKSGKVEPKILHHFSKSGKVEPNPFDRLFPNYDFAPLFGFSFAF
jgi:hypothetical protein